MIYTINQNKNSYKSDNYYQIVKEANKQRNANKAIISDYLKEYSGTLKSIIFNAKLLPVERLVLSNLNYIISRYKSGFNGFSLRKLSQRIGYSIGTIRNALTTLNRRFNLTLFTVSGCLKIEKIQALKEKVFGDFLPHKWHYLKELLNTAKPVYKKTFSQYLHEREQANKQQYSRRPAYNPMQPIAKALTPPAPEQIRQIKPPEPPPPEQEWTPPDPEQMARANKILDAIRAKLKAKC